MLVRPAGLQLPIPGNQLPLIIATAAVVFQSNDNIPDVFLPYIT